MPSTPNQAYRHVWTSANRYPRQASDPPSDRANKEYEGHPTGHRASQQPKRQKVNAKPYWERWKTTISRQNVFKHVVKPPSRVAQLPPSLARKRKTIVYTMLFHAEHAKPSFPPRLDNRQSISPPSIRAAKRPSYQKIRRASNGRPSQPPTEAPKSKCQTLLGTMENIDLALKCVQTRREITKSCISISLVRHDSGKASKIW